MHVLIIGGGIAGPVTAMALQRAGIDATVFEAYPDGAAAAAGAWLTLAANGLDALRTLDLHRTAMACGFPSQRIEMQNHTGRVLGTIPIGGVLADGTVTHTLARGALHRALQVEAQRRGIRIVHDRRLVDARAEGGGVVAEFSDGTAVRGDVLLGADGLHSRVRRLIDPTAPVPRYSGLGNVGGFAPPGCADIPPGVYRMVFGRRAFFGYTVSPAGEIWWFANPLRPIEPSRAELAAITAAQWKAEVSALFTDDAGPAAAIVRATEGPITGTGTYDLPRVPVWSRGPILILGDAAHAAAPSSGQGASMAIEDGVEIARCLRDLPVPDALAAFESLRRARVERVVAEGARRGASKTAGPVGRVLRDLLLPVFLRRAARNTGAYTWLYDHHIDWDARVGDRRGASERRSHVDGNRSAPAA